MRIPAIILSYDDNHAYAAHLIHRYQELWPGHPFQFVLPYQSGAGLAAWQGEGQLLKGRDLPITLVQSPPAIKATVLTLLQAYADDQWIYWCIDDKYPLLLDRIFLERLSHAIATDALTDIHGICFCRSRQLATGKALMANGLGLWQARCHPLAGPLLRRKNFAQIWLHQYIRVGVLRSLFEAFPDEIAAAKDLDRLKRLIPLRSEHHLYVTAGHYASFGESTTRGLVTRNCAESMANSGIAAPTPHRCSNRDIIIGSGRAHRRPDRWLRSMASIAYASWQDGFRRGRKAITRAARTRPWLR
jgi:hypothetical protein